MTTPEAVTVFRDLMTCGVLALAAWALALVIRDLRRGWPEGREEP